MRDLTFPLKAAFLALPLEGDAKWQYQALQEELRSFEDVLRFQNPRSPHLTLHYWGEVMEIEMSAIVRQAEAIAAKHDPFSLHVTSAATLGKRGEDRVLYLDVAFSPELARLKKSSPWPEGREFRPHITLARIRHPQKFAVVKKKVLKALGDCSFPVPVDRLRLYAEVEGVKQTPLQDFELTGGNQRHEEQDGEE